MQKFNEIIDVQKLTIVIDNHEQLKVIDSELEILKKIQRACKKDGVLQTNYITAGKSSQFYGKIVLKGLGLGDLSCEMINTITSQYTTMKVNEEHFKKMIEMKYQVKDYDQLVSTELGKEVKKTLFKAKVKASELPKRVISYILNNEIQSLQYNLIKALNTDTITILSNGCIMIYNLNDNNNSLTDFRIVEVKSFDIKGMKSLKSPLEDPLIKLVFDEPNEFSYVKLLVNRLKKSEKFICSELSKTDSHFYYFNGIQWIADTSYHYIRKEIIEDDIIGSIIKVNHKERDKIIDEYSNANKRNRIINSAALNLYDKEFLSKIDRNHNLLHFSDGYCYDFQLTKYRKTEPVDLNTKTTCMKHNENIDKTKVNKIEDILHKIFPDPELYENSLVCIASSIVSHNKHQKFNIWLGQSGANGKSMLLSMILGVLGDYATQSNSAIFVGHNFNNTSSARPELLALKNCRFVAISEPEEGFSFNESVIKHFCGSEREQVRGLYQGLQEIILDFNIHMLCNIIPSIANGMKTSQEINSTFRRWYDNLFESQFVDPKFVNEKLHKYAIDYDLSDKMKQDEYKDSFMHILITYCNKYISNGYLLPESEKQIQAKNKYRDDNNYIKSFITETIMITENQQDILPLKSIWGKFLAYVKRIDHNISIKDQTKTVIKDELLEFIKGHQGCSLIDRKKINGDVHCNVFSGLKINFYGTEFIREPECLIRDESDESVETKVETKAEVKTAVSTAVKTEGVALSLNQIQHLTEKFYAPDGKVKTKLITPCLLRDDGTWEQRDTILDVMDKAKLDPKKYQINFKPKKN